MPLVDLDDPEELRARWTALAAVAHATGFDRRWYADADGYHHQDETASVLRMLRLEDGRAVLFGFHTQHSQTAGADLLAGSPDWIGQPEVRQRMAAGQLGFVYGAFNGTWARASYPGDPWQPVEDGFAPIGQWVTSDEAAADEMIEWVAGWADYLGGLDELRPFGVQLIRSVGASGVTAGALQSFFDRFEIDPRSPVQPDLPAGVVAGEDFTRNFAVPESFPDEPDTAEVSVVEDVVIGASDSGPGDDEEELFVVPPGISPFTGQPIDDPPPRMTPPAHDEAPAARDEEYGVTAKKQGWLRLRKHDDAAGSDADFPSEAGAYPPDVSAQGGPAPGTYLPDGMTGTGLPMRPAYDSPLPSSEPPRVGGGVHEGDDFYASLFADAPAAAGYQDTPAPDEQDWETAEQPAWSEQEATSEYNPFADEPPTDPHRDWVGGAWINGEWVEDPTTHRPNPPPPNSPPTPSPFDAPTADTPFLQPAEDPSAESSFAPGSPAPARSPFAPTHPADAPTADTPFIQSAERPSAEAPFTPGSPAPAGSPFAPTHPADAPTADTPFLQSAERPSAEAPFAPGNPAPAGPPFAPAHPADAPTADTPFITPADSPSANSPSAPSGSADSASADSPFAPTSTAADPEDDDAPTAEIAAVLDTDPDEEEPSSFTGPSPFAPVPHPEPTTTPPTHPDTPHPTDHPTPLAAHPTDASTAPVTPAARQTDLAAQSAAGDRLSAPSAPAAPFSAPHADPAAEPAPDARFSARTTDSAAPAVRFSDPSAEADNADDQTAEIPAVPADSTEPAADERQAPTAAEAHQAPAAAEAHQAPAAAEAHRTSAAAHAHEAPAAADEHQALAAAEEQRASAAAGETYREARDGLAGDARPGLRFNGVDEDDEEQGYDVPAPAAKAQVEPHPQPQPWPQPQPHPEPWPQPEPHPAPWPDPTPPSPEPTPAPDPYPTPTPGPDPYPAPPTPGPEPHPQPIPGPTPDPIPGPDPQPEPQPNPNPDPQPWPDPEPVPQPEPEPGPRPEPEPAPWPDPEPSPEPDPTPRPEPTTHVAHGQWPDADPHSPQQDSTRQPERTTRVAHDDWTDSGEPESSPEHGAASHLKRTTQVAHDDWADSGEPGSSREDDLESHLERTMDVAQAGWAEDSEAAEHAGADVSAGFAPDEDDEPTGFVPVIGDDWPTGSFPAVNGFADEATETERHNGDERNGASHGVRGESAADVVARMSIPGLGLVGADGPRIAPPPGSIEEAMRSEVERPRPRPQESDAVKALHAWCRARTAIVPSGFTIQIQVLDPSAPSYRFDLEPPDVDDPEFAMDKLSGLLGDLWQTEAQSDVGGWLFARIDAAGRTLRIDRWYDQVPDWWDNPIEPRLDVHGLVRRLYNRGPQWQPSYLEKLYTTAR